MVVVPSIRSLLEMVVIELHEHQSKIESKSQSTVQSIVQSNPGFTPLLRSAVYGIGHNHIQPSGFTLGLVLYVVTALVHYIPYSTIIVGCINYNTVTLALTV